MEYTNFAAVGLAHQECSTSVLAGFHILAGRADGRHEEALLTRIVPVAVVAENLPGGHRGSEPITALDPAGNAPTALRDRLLQLPDHDACVDHATDVLARDTDDRPAVTEGGAESVAPLRFPRDAPGALAVLDAASAGQRLDREPSGGTRIGSAGQVLTRGTDP